MIDLLCHSVAVKGNQLTQKRNRYPSRAPRPVLLPECVVNFTQALHGEPHVDRKLSALGIAERKAWSGAGVMPELGGLEYLAGPRSNCRTNPRQMEVGVIPSMNFYHGYRSLVIELWNPLAHP